MGRKKMQANLQQQQHALQRDQQLVQYRWHSQALQKLC
jgi:cell fate (sporulation/competence/biofilm development) regulator YlbF (YheA/YmcA/DUF963 family)